MTGPLLLPDEVTALVVAHYATAADLTVEGDMAELGRWLRALSYGNEDWTEYGRVHCEGQVEYLTDRIVDALGSIPLPDTGFHWAADPVVGDSQENRDRGMCESAYHDPALPYQCSRPYGHPGSHAAGDGRVYVHVWLAERRPGRCSEGSGRDVLKAVWPQDVRITPEVAAQQRGALVARAKDRSP